METSTDAPVTASETATTGDAPPAEAGTNAPAQGAATAPLVQPSDERARLVRMHVAELCKEALDYLSGTPWSARTILCALADELMWKACQIKEEPK